MDLLQNIEDTFKYMDIPSEKQVKFVSHKLQVIA